MCYHDEQIIMDMATTCRDIRFGYLCKDINDKLGPYNSNKTYRTKARFQAVVDQQQVKEVTKYFVKLYNLALEIMDQQLRCAVIGFLDRKLCYTINNIDDAVFAMYHHGYYIPPFDQYSDTVFDSYLEYDDEVFVDDNYVYMD